MSRSEEAARLRAEADALVEVQRTERGYTKGPDVMIGEKKRPTLLIGHGNFTPEMWGRAALILRLRRRAARLEHP